MVVCHTTQYAAFFDRATAYGKRMTEFRSRAYRAEDAATVAELINLVADAGGGPGGHAAAEIREFVANEVKDASVDTRLVVDEDDRLLAVALVPQPPAGGHRVELIGGVHPDRCGAGIGRALLGWQLERATARRAEAAPDARWSGSVACGVAATAAIRLYKRFGFTVGRYFLEMSAPTTASLPVPMVDGVRIEPYHEDLARAVHVAHAQAFRELWGYEERGFEPWAALTVRSETFLPSLARVAVADDEIVGYVLPYDTGVVGRCYIGQIGTLPAWRKRGIAHGLLASVLAAAGQAGYTRAALDTDAENPTGAPSVYAAAGFVIDQHIVVYHKSV
jgi:mycothiol synthase